MAEEREKDSDDECLKIMCSPIDDFDDLNVIPVVTHPATKRRDVTCNTSKTELGTETGCKLKISEQVLKYQESNGKMEAEKKLNNNFKTPRRLESKSNKGLSGCQRLPKDRKLETTSPCSEDLNSTPVSIQTKLRKLNRLKNELSRNKKIRVDLTELIPSSQQVDVNESFPTTPAFHGKKYEKMLTSEFEESYPSFGEETNTIQIQQENKSTRAIRVPPYRNNSTDLNISKSNKTFLNSSAKLSSAVRSGFPNNGSKFASPPESRIEHIPDDRIIDLNTLLNACENWECRKRNIHQIPTDSANLNSQRAEELGSSFIDHLPLILKLMWGNKFEISPRNHHFLVMELLEAIKVSLRNDMCHAISLLLRTAISYFNKHYRMIHDILFNIKRLKIRNILEAVRPLLSMKDFHWPPWLQQRLVSDSIADKTLLSQQDYTALSQVLPSQLFDRLQRDRNLMSAGSFTQKSLDQSKSPFVPFGNMNSKSLVQPVIECRDQNPSSTIIPEHFNNNNHLPVPVSRHSNMNSKSLVQPEIECRDENPSNTIIPTQFNNNNHLPVSVSRQSNMNTKPVMECRDHNPSNTIIPSQFSYNNHFPVSISPITSSQSTLELSANSNCVQMSKVIMELILSTRLHSALDMLEKFDAKQLYKVAHDIFIQHAAEYVKVVDALMGYFKERRFMHVLIKNLNAFMSTLTFNLVVKLIKDESKEKACSLFHAILESGFEYLNAQIFPESLGETNSPSPMNNVLIAVDLLITSDNYDRVVQLFIDNRLLGDASEWKVRPTSEFDIELRDGCIERVLSSFLEDNRPRVTMLACRIFAEMQKQRCPLASNTDRVIQLLKKLLSISTFNKLAYEIFKKFYSTADNTSKCTLLINEPSICRAMLVLSNSIDPEGRAILLEELIESGVYPKWKTESGIIEVHSNWVRIETEALLENFIQQLVSRPGSPTLFGSPLPDELAISVEECEREEAIVTLKVDSSYDAAVKELQEILFSFRPSVRSVARNRTLFTLRHDWKNYLRTRQLNHNDE